MNGFSCLLQDFLMRPVELFSVRLGSDGRVRDIRETDDSMSRVLHANWVSTLVTGIFLLMTPILSVQTAYAAQDSSNSLIAEKRAVALRTSAPIQVDGFLNEDAWQSSRPIGEILQREPREGEPATEKTEVRLRIHRGLADSGRRRC
jgi:hypothetical protein